MRAFEVMTVDFDTIILLLISALLMIYLVYALLRPERF